jgi:hypothetical protein
MALIQESLSVAHKTGALATRDLERVVVDPTVQPKAIAHPTDARLCHRALQEAVKPICASASNCRVRSSLTLDCRFRVCRSLAATRRINRRRGDYSTNSGSFGTCSAGRSPHEKESASSSGFFVTRTIPPFASSPNSSSSASGFLMCS